MALITHSARADRGRSTICVSRSKAAPVDHSVDCEISRPPRPTDHAGASDLPA